MLLPSSGGMTKDEAPRSKLRSGTSGAGLGGSSLKGLPLASVSVSVSGLNESFPESDMATTISGLAIKFMVVGWPSLRIGKLRLYDVTMVLARRPSPASGAIAQCRGHRHSPRLWH